MFAQFYTLSWCLLLVIIENRTLIAEDFRFTYFSIFAKSMNHRVTEYPDLEGTHKDNLVPHRSPQNLNPMSESIV